jgi:pSer/pThr/pTyr-binding forkhead associated (FHA) protein
MANVNNPLMAQFLEACGGTGPLQLNVEYQASQESVRHLLHQPFVVIGRDGRADILLDHVQVSRCHAYLQLIGGRLFCVDLESRNGTHWEKGAKRSGWLDYNKALRIGPYWIRLLRENTNGQAAAPGSWNLAATPPGSSGFPDITLEFINWGPQSPTWKMAPLLALVGNSPECRVHLVGQSTSNFHCSLLRTPTGVWVVDLLGRNGTRVNDESVRCARLNDGDRLQVGRFLIRIRYDSQPTDSPNPITLGESPSLSVESPNSRPTLFPAQRNEYRSPGGPSEEDPGQTVTSPAMASPPSPPLVTSLLVSAQLAEEPPGHSSGQELVPLPATPPAAQEDLARSLLVPIAQQLGQMQQQMFDQFQQAMMMMFQMFHTLQRDQIKVIREELDHLQGLTEELQSLQAELRQRSPAATAKAPLPPTAGFTAHTRTDPAAGSARPPAASQPPGGKHPKKPTPGPRPQPVAPSAAPGPSAAAASPKVMPQGQSDENLHAWLSERILAIQQERQSRWQKVMNFLTGKQTEERTP